MMFSKKFAKIGRAKRANIRKRTDGIFDVLLSDTQTTKRELVINGTSYNLGMVNSTYIYTNMKMLTDSLCVACVEDNNFSVVEIE